METKHLKKYAPEARRDFIAAVKNKAAVYGLLPKEILPMQEEGDVVIIGDRPFPRTVAKQRNELEARIRKEGFQQFIESIAYTWFNRFVAIRYMELHGYLDHGYRVLSHPEGKSAPEILENAERVELPGLKRDEVVDLKLDGGKDEQLYQMLLLAQCNALHKAMPFLFESIKDGTELLLPDNLLHTDSLVRTLVNDIPVDQWDNVEIIGWLYQFYISEKKDQVIGKVVKSEDIPAATQLFTPNWIVRYMLHNTLGRKWMATYPDSPLKQQMEFYIDPCEQTAEVQQQLDEITPDSLNPEELTLLDPACGSGHILVEAYDLFKAIYEERGYRARDIPKLILTKNLFGLEIDDRAVQLAAFALTMKARADDRRIFDADVRPNVVAFVETSDLNSIDITNVLNLEVSQSSPTATANLISNPSRSDEVSKSDVIALLTCFPNAKTLGSLTYIPPAVADSLPRIDARITAIANERKDLFSQLALHFAPVVVQAQMLCRQYSLVVTNPPYMGTKAMNTSLKDYLSKTLPSGKSDVFTGFILRCKDLVSDNNDSAFVVPFVWMFLSTYLSFRDEVLRSSTITTLVQLEYNAFQPACVPVCIVSFARLARPDYHATCINLATFKGHQNQAPRTLEAIRDSNCEWKHRFAGADISHLPNRPIAYWLTKSIHRAFREEPLLADLGELGQGSTIGDNEQFIRWWYEVNATTPEKWLPCIKGGAFRRWGGNRGRVVYWADDGKDLLAFDRATIRNVSLMGKGGIDWSRVTNSLNSFRLFDGPVFAESGGGFLYLDGDLRYRVVAFLNSKVAQHILRAINPTLNCQTGDVGGLPFIDVADLDDVKELYSISTFDWNTHETSSGFLSSPLLRGERHERTIRDSVEKTSTECIKRIQRMKELEDKNNERFVNAYGLDQELIPEVPEDEVTLYRPELKEDTRRLISYSVGCMMGRYSLDEPGLIYASSGNEGFDQTRYRKVSADEDGVIPVTDTDWFPDDAPSRFEQFIKAAWPEEYVEENLKFVAECLDQKKGETTRNCIRRYMATGFFKHHLSLYKKRPIYWLFSSGKQRAFQCLVYLHRYNTGTLSRMRTEYVVKLQGKINARIEQLESDIPSAGSTSHRKKLEKERDTLIKQREELQTFDEKLRHYADQRIELNLDDGVKVNYGKFGDLLAEVKTVTGEKAQS